MKDSKSSANMTLKVWIKNGLRKYYWIRNSFNNVIWPTSPLNLSLICCGLFMTLATDKSLSSLCKPLTKKFWGIPEQLSIKEGLSIIIISTIVVCVFIIILLRQYLLRMLLTYRGWMNIVPTAKEPPKEVVLWGLIVRLVSGYQPSLYSFQRSLPRMPVPPLKDTLRKLYNSLRPVCSDEEYLRIKQQGEEFAATIGPKLHRALLLKSWLTPNYVSDWWEKYAYLKNRSPLPNHSNYYIIGNVDWTPTHRPASRAAGLGLSLLRFKRSIDREELSPLLWQNLIPLCMEQYKRSFSTTRIPMEDVDQSKHYPTKDSKHIIVICKGIYYRVDVYDSRNQLISAKNLEKLIEWLMNDAEKHTINDEEKSIAALTTLERNEWAQIRKDYLCSGVNQFSREIIESSIFVLSLIDESSGTLSNKGKWLLHGDGKSLWFDKCMNLLVFADGQYGINFEHTHADALVYAHLMETTVKYEFTERMYDDDGTCTPPLRNFKQSYIASPSRLIWDINDEFKMKIRNAYKIAVKDNNDIDLVVCDHNNWGKGEIKKCKISPDAFVQMSIQLAYYKDNGKFVSTYEASMTRLYLNGRTETVRSCTNDAANFVTAMTKNNESKEEKIKLLNIAAAKHTYLYKEAMNGKGIDRHLFALYVASKGLGYESEFLQNVLSREWILSTSQSPYSQLPDHVDPSDKKYHNKLCAGGGFAPVSDEGYGVGYLFPNDHAIFFHISSKFSCPHTDSNRFKDLIYQSMEEIRALFM